jgi:hypothetical protein
LSNSPKKTFENSSANLIPGPGTYSSKDTLDKKGTIIGRSVRSGIRLNGVPGPGHYKIPVRIGDVPRYLIPSQNEEFKYV